MTFNHVFEGREIKQFQDLLVLRSATDSKNGFYQEIRSDPKLQALFNAVLKDEAWVLLHQGLVVDAVTGIFPGFEGGEKLEAISTQISPLDRGIKRAWEGTFNEGAESSMDQGIEKKPIEEFLKALERGEFINAISRVKEVDPRTIDVKRMTQTIRRFNLEQKAVFYLSIGHYPNEIKSLIFNEVLEDPDLKNPKIIRSLLKASEGNLDLKRVLFDSPWDSNPLHTAVDSEDLELVHSLLDSCEGDRGLLMNLFKPNFEGWTPIQLAAENKKLEMVKAMVEACKGSVELKKTLFNPNSIEWSVLHFAVNENQIEMVQFLLQVSDGNPELLALLIAKMQSDEDEELADEEVDLPLLQLAIFNKSLSILSLLIDALGEEWNDLKETLYQQNQEGLNPLHYALANNRKNSVHLLIQAGLKDRKLLELLFEQSGEGLSPLFFAEGDPEFGELLINACQGDRALLLMLLRPNNEGMTPFHWYAKRNDLSFVNMIIKASQNDRELIKLLVRPDNLENTPLIYAALEDNLEIVEAILACTLSEEIEIKEILFQENQNEETPLDHAIDHNNSKMIKIFLDLVIEINFPLDSVLSDRENCDFLVIRYPEYLHRLIENLGGYGAMTFERRLSILPILPPNLIESTINELSFESLNELLEERIEVGEFNYSTLEYFEKLIIEHGLTTLTAETIESVGDEIENDLEEFLFRDFSAFAKLHPLEAVQFLDVSNDARRASMIPFLPIDILSHFLTSKSPIEIATYIAQMTTAQKEALLQMPELFPNSPYAFNTIAWKERIDAIRRGEENLDERVQGEIGEQLANLSSQPTEINQLQLAYKKNEQAPFQSLVDQSFQQFNQEKMLSSLEEAKAVQAELKSFLYSQPKKQEIDERFIDPLLGEIMRNPVLLPKNSPGDPDYWLDQETLFSLVTNEDGKVRHPIYDNPPLYFERELLKVDEELKAQIEAPQE